MIEQLLMQAPLHREIMVQRNGASYTFACGRHTLLSKLRSYIYLLDCRGLIQVNYISDIYKYRDESYSFKLVLQALAQ